MRIFISNFQSPVELADLMDRFMTDGKTNIDILLSDHDEDGYTEWTVHKDAKEGDIVLFMCARTSKDHMAHLCVETKKTGHEELIAYAEHERDLYKQYAGKIVAVGTMMDNAFQTYDPGYKYAYWRSPWYGEIDGLQLLDKPIDISEFRDFITVSRTGAITLLDSDQWDQLKEIIRAENPDVEFGKRTYYKPKAEYFLYQSKNVLMHYQGNWYEYVNSWLKIPESEEAIMYAPIFNCGGDYASIGMKPIDEDEALKRAIGKNRDELAVLPPDWYTMRPIKIIVWCPEYYILRDEFGGFIEYVPFMPLYTRKSLESFFTFFRENMEQQEDQ